MSVYHLDLLAKFNQGANREMDAIIKTLTEDQWNKNFGGFFSSVHSLCSHIYVCDFNWLLRYKALREFKTLGGGFFAKGPYSFDKTIFADIAEYLAMRPVLDEKIIAFMDEIKPEDLDKPLVYKDSSGQQFSRRFEGCLLQVLNHETHHRAMVSLYLELLGKQNDFNNVSTYVTKSNV
jgi:uncharacterized damage-inducible protein DinB